MPPGKGGTSPTITITGQALAVLTGIQLSPIQNDGQIVNPPVPNGTLPSEAMYIYTNPYRDFSFPKISPPQYKSMNNNYDLPLITQQPINNPDFVADYHFISLMRLVDKFMQHSYKGYLGGTITTVKPY